MRSLLSVKDVAPKHSKIYKWARFGRDFDGGYVMFDDFNKDSIAYSFGVSYDDSWETDIAKKGIDVFMYDPTVSSTHSKNNRFHFEKLGITGYKKAANMKTMSEFIKKNGHKNKTNLVLKMDVEGAEWDFLNEVDERTLNQFSQIVLELHWFQKKDLADTILPALQKLNKTHQIVHVHGNNHVGVVRCSDIMIPEVMEITCLRKSSYNFVESKKYFPTGLDRKNHPERPEIILGYDFSDIKN